MLHKVLRKALIWGKAQSEFRQSHKPLPYYLLLLCQCIKYFLPLAARAILVEIIYIFNGCCAKCLSITSNKNLALKTSSVRPSLSLCKYFFFKSRICLVWLCRHSLPLVLQWLTVSAVGVTLVVVVGGGCGCCMECLKRSSQCATPEINK